MQNLGRFPSFGGSCNSLFVSFCFSWRFIFYFTSFFSGVALIYDVSMSVGKHCGVTPSVSSSFMENKFDAPGPLQGAHRWCEAMSVGLGHSLGAKEGQVQGRSTELFPTHIQDSPLSRYRPGHVPAMSPCFSSSRLHPLPAGYHHF